MAFFISLVMRIATIILGIILSFNGFTQSVIDRVEPPHWWVGMKNPDVQLMIHGERIAEWEFSSKDPFVHVVDVQAQKNPNYAFVKLMVTPEAKAGEVELEMKKGNKKETLTYTLKERREGSADREGFSTEDVVYLITPDRFANGDPSNDEVEEMEEGLDRTDKLGRHGGDIKGIRDHLDYIDQMGFTALWSCPVIENAQPKYSYHGYSSTDFYRVDPRMGTNTDYVALSAEVKERDMKLVMDMIMNHIGSGHWWMDDHPSEDWVNNGWEYLWNRHFRSTLHDPHSAASDSLSMTDGWFAETMPDLNQRNPFLATYLIQNSIWWIEEADLDGIRMDTYPYPDKDFMADWSCAVMKEYPNFNIVGEEWTLNPAYISHWQRGNKRGYPSCVPSMFDFPVQRALIDALNEEESWWGGWNKLYEAIAQDYQYPEANNLMIFGDNHDMDRFYLQVGEDLAKYKLGMTFLLTTRGIPQIYYGTELLMVNSEKDDHGLIRIDFPGGWKGDATNGFTGKNLPEDQKEAQAFLKKVLNWRQTAEVVHDGSLLHYGPEKATYVYFRKRGDKNLMVVLNKNKEAIELGLERFQEGIGNADMGTDILSGKEVSLITPLKLSPMTPMIIEF